MTKALFLDRDGVLNIDHGYIGDPDRIDLVPGVVDLLHHAQKLGFILVIVTNQSGIARGYFSEDDYLGVERRLKGIFAEKKIFFSAIFYCPHHPNGKGEFAIHCDCRKPAPGMILKAAQALNIDLENSLLIGDKCSDVEAAKAAGVGLAFLVEEYVEGGGSIFDKVEEYLSSLD